MEEVLKAIEGDAAIELDRNPDGFVSLSRASAMVSDISGVIFDYAFVFLRPVVAVGPGPVKEGFEAWEIPHPAWEQEILPKIGERVLEADEATLLAALRRVMNAKDALKERIRSIRDAHIIHFGCAADPIAQALIEEETREAHRD